MKKNDSMLNFSVHLIESYLFNEFFFVFHEILEK